MKIPLIIHLTHSIVLALCLSIKQIKQIFILGIISQEKTVLSLTKQYSETFQPLP